MGKFNSVYQTMLETLKNAVTRVNHTRFKFYEL